MEKHTLPPTTDIDFHTKFCEENYKDLFDRAADMGFGCIVMEGIPNYIHRGKDIQSFSDKGHKTIVIPAQKVLWKATAKGFVEIPDPKSPEIPGEYEERTFNFTGELLSILPTPHYSRFDGKHTHDLGILLRSIKKFRGISISLHNENNSLVPSYMLDDRRKYHFDCYRVIQNNDIEMRHERRVCRELGQLPVFATGAEKPDDFQDISIFTTYDEEIRSRDDLIEAVKNRSSGFRDCIVDFN